MEDAAVQVQSRLFALWPTSPRRSQKLAEGIGAGNTFQTLLGVTGSGKTATMGFVIEKVQKPTLVLAHNKTLAAQLCSEFREFFPDNSVEYFVSYYDYYQPEAYVPQQDLYIEKDSSINDEIDRLRHSATAALFARKDVIIVASVSAIYGIGSPDLYREKMLLLKAGEWIDRDATLRQLVSMQYTRNDQNLVRGNLPRARRGARGPSLLRGERLPRAALRRRDRANPALRSAHGRDTSRARPRVRLARDALRDGRRHHRAVAARDQARAERAREVARVSTDRVLEAHRLRQRTEFDMEMLKEMGYCSGIENYSRILDGRPAGSPPHTLIDYFPDDFICFIDESHQTVPQIGGMYEGDRSRKQTLVDFGFRLPSALDNRPLRFDEFLQRVPQMVFVSATPGPYEREHSEQTVEQIVRPTGIVDPEVEVRETRNQIDDLMNEIRGRAEVNERVLVTTLTKKMAEDLTGYLLEHGFRVRYLHSEIDTIERIQIIRDLRLGEYDVLVGVNLLREGLDLPEVSLIGILDADKEGFLRGETSLIQTIGRAARNVRGRVLMYADKETAAMRAAIGETNRRRAIQVAYNEEHGITAETVKKGISDITEFLSLEDRVVPRSSRKRAKRDEEQRSPEELERLIVEIEEEMFAAAEDLRFEYAAKLGTRSRSCAGSTRGSRAHLRDDAVRARSRKQGSRHRARSGA